MICGDLRAVMVDEVPRLSRHQCSGDAIQGMNEANFGAPKVDA